MKKILMLLVAVALGIAAPFAYATYTTGTSSGWEPVTFDSSISFTATKQADGTVKTVWSKYAHAESFTYYKVVRSSTNTSPVYPDDGYIFYGGDVGVTSYIDAKAPAGTNYYRVCQMASPKRYCSATVVKIDNQTSSTVVVTEPATSSTTTTPTTTTTPESSIDYSNYVDGFNDVKKGTDLGVCVEKLAQEEIVLRKVSERIAFRPNDSLNRAEALKLMMIAFYPESKTTIANSCFSDVENSSWYSKFVCYAKSKNIISGYYDGRIFRPARFVSRTEALSMMLKTLQLPLEQAPTMSIPEAPELWQKQVVSTAYKNGLVAAADSLTFGSLDLMTRAEAATLMCRALDKERNMQF